MPSLRSHVSRCFFAGIIALLPIGAMVLTVGYTESLIRSSLFAEQSFYFPGLGLLAVALSVYVIGFLVTTFVGRVLWGAIDSVLKHLPAVGQLYQTLKQILGYGEGEDALFLDVVLIPARDTEAEQLGLVTNRTTAGDGTKKLIVFVPGAPSPAAGRLIVIDADQATPVDMPVHEAMKALLSLGKTPLPCG